MSVRKREWVTAKGESKSAWIVDYQDTTGKRRLKTFKLKKQADQFAATATVEVREGVHVADSASVTVKQAGALWQASAQASGLERSSLAQYRQHIDLHIVPLIGDTLLSKLTVPAVRTFEDQLRQQGRSTAMVRKVLVSLGSLLADAQERGLVVRNSVREKSRTRAKGTDRRVERRQKGKLRIGVDIPTTDEIRALVAVLKGRYRAILLTAIFAGLRASEIRGLRWSDIDFAKNLIHVRQRADRYREIGPPKSEAGERTIAVMPLAMNAIKEWKLACPKGELDLAFPNLQGNVEELGNIIRRGFMPAQVRAGIVVDSGERDDKGEPIMVAKYTGLHALRHYHASWLINRKEDGGLGWPAKSVQERLGHANIAITLDTYSHLFPRVDGDAEMAAAERAFLNVRDMGAT